MAVELSDKSLLIGGASRRIVKLLYIGTEWANLATKRKMNVEIDAGWSRRPLDFLSAKDNRGPVAGKNQTENSRYPVQHLVKHAVDSDLLSLSRLAEELAGIIL